jgi:flagellar biosynthesis GTPase FlhF
MIKKAHETHKEALAQKAKYYVPLDAARKSVKKLMSDYDEEQERIRREEQRRLEELSRKQEEERLLAEAIAAEAELKAAGATQEEIAQEVETIIEQPVAVAPIIIPKSTPKVTGGPVYQERWYANVTDIKALCKAVSHDLTCNELLDLAGKMPDSIAKKEIIHFLRSWNATSVRASTECVLPNMPTLNRMAVALKKTLNIPGVQALSKRV